MSGQVDYIPKWHKLEAELKKSINDYDKAIKVANKAKDLHSILSLDGEKQGIVFALNLMSQIQKE